MIDVIESPPEIESEEPTYICQFCGEETPTKQWIDDIICPICDKKYDERLAQDSEE